MSWKKKRIKELEIHIKEREEWLEERKEFSRKLRQWNAEDYEKITELKNSIERKVSIPGK